MPNVATVLQRGFARRALIVLIACGAAIAGTWTLVAERAGYEERNAVEDAQRQSVDLAVAFEQQAMRQIQSIDQLVQFVRHEYVEEGDRVDLREVLAYSVIDPAAILYVAVIDAQGMLRFSTYARPGLDLSDRDYFVAHAADPTDALRISKPTAARSDGRRVINFSRRISGPDGRFLGVALVGTAADYLAQGSQHFDIGARGELILLGEDGIARARRVGRTPSADVDMTDSRLFARTREAEVGSFVSRGRIDDVPRFMSYRRLAGYPLVAAIGIPVDEALAAVHARKRIYYGSAAAGTLAALLLSLALLAALWRQKRALDERRRAEERYRTTFDQAPVGIAHQAPDGSFIRANRRFCAMLGYTEPELLTKKFTDILVRDDAARALEQNHEFFSGPLPAQLRVENRHLRKDGTVFLGAVTVGRVAAADGRPYGVVMVEDITEQRAAESARRESEARFRELAENITEVFWLADPDTSRMLYVSPAYERIWGRRCEEVYASPGRWSEAIHPEDRPRVLQAGRARQAGDQHCEEYRIVRPDGQVRWIRDRAFPVLRHGQVYRIAGVAEDISERKSAEESMRGAEARYRATFDQAVIGVGHATLDGTFLSVNRKLASMLGYEPRELVGRNAREITHPEHRRITDPARTHFLQHPEDSLVPEYEKRYVRKDGSALWASVALALVRDVGGAPDYVIALVKDVSAQRRAEEKLVHQAHYDALTELPNRTLFYDRLAQTLTQARRHEWTIGVMTIDLDRFNTINDTLGHAQGDKLLAEVAKRLALAVRSGDTVARLGGDEFGVIAAELSHPQDAGLVARKIMDALKLSFDFGGQEVFISASAGIATYPMDGRDGTALMKNADAAMFRAKELGRNNFQFYTASMNERAADKLHLETELRRALERNEFRLHFQPKASLATGCIGGLEALLRWQRPGGELASPAQFVPLLEETGLIVPVGDWVIRAACAQIAEWRKEGLTPVPVAVNLSAKQFTHRDIVAIVDAALSEYAVPAELLELEITESDAMQAPEATMGMLRRLVERGVHIAIDDFGTGYSSLSYLKRFPLDTLKLDRSFVKDLPDDSDDASIARAVITMAHSLGLAVVAEGVETVAQRRLLAAEGCDQMQGYLLSRPVPAAQCAQWLLSSAPAIAA